MTMMKWIKLFNSSGGSDVEGRVSPGAGDAHLPEFQEPDNDLKDRIIKQVICLNW
jgi:hypothetical protein